MSKPLLLLLCCLACGIRSLVAVDAIGDDLKAKLTARTQAFWEAFYREDVQAMKDVADDVLIEDIQKGLWLRARWERIHHVQPHPAPAADAVVPKIEITGIATTRIMCMQAVIRQIDSYQVSFTADGFTGWVGIAKDDPMLVIALKDDPETTAK